MRNIEEIAAEEEARVQASRGRFFRRSFGVLAVGAGLWGWHLFSQGLMGAGASYVLLSLLLLGLSWEAFKLPELKTSLLAALVVGGASLLLYWTTAMPSFYWGKDPDFWLAVHAGAVPDPPWSPLGYLLGQALCWWMPGEKFSILPKLSGLVLSLCLFFTVLEFIRRMRSRGPLGSWMSILVAGALALSLPFWNAGTIASGLTASLGLLLFLFQRSLLDREDRPWKALTLLLGLLFSVHPLWGVLGLLRHLASKDAEGRRILSLGFPLFAGLSPYLWIHLRAAEVLPSWGGSQPFWEVLKGWKGPWAAKAAAGFEASSALGAFGVLTGALVLLAVVLLLLNTFQWRNTGRSITEPMDFWTGILAGLFGLFFHSASSETLAPVALWFPVGVGGLVLRLLEKGWEKRHPSWGSGVRLAGMTAAFLLLSSAAALGLGEKCLRAGYFLPLQHAFNLLRALPEPTGKGPEWPGGTLLVCEDPFEASACLEARLIQPFKLQAVILERRYLNRKWMVSQCIRWEPRLLFSTAEGSTLGILRNLVRDNGDRWEIHWAVSELSDALGLGPAFPTVLTQAFRQGAPSQEAAKAQYHYDLTPFMAGDGELDRPSRRCRSRYAAGFHEMGQRLLAQGKAPSAIQAFERSTKLDPEYQEPQMQLSDLYAKKNILEAARLEFERVVKEHPGKIAFRMKELEKEGGMDSPSAAGLLDELIRLNGELAEAQFQLYRIFDKQGRGAEARALLEGSAKNAPKRIEVQLALGRKMLELGQKVKAGEAFRAVLMIDPQNKEAQRELWRLLNRS